MSKIFVDTVRLKERYEKGSSLRLKLFDDLDRLETDVRSLCETLKKEGNIEKADELSKLSESIRDLLTNITDVCEFDRFAIRRYETAMSRIDSIVSSVEA